MPNESTEQTARRVPGSDQQETALMELQQPIRRTGGQYTTAIDVMRPRDPDLVRTQLVKEANIAGEDFYYAWSVSSKDGSKGLISGPSIGLAQRAAALWGNCAVEIVSIQDDPKSWTFIFAFIDLETGFTDMRAKRQSKFSTVYGKMDEDRKEDIRFQAGQSKAKRNVIVRALPTWLISAAVEHAKNSVIHRLEERIAKQGIEKVVESALATALKQGIDEQSILTKFQREEKNKLNAEDLALLTADLRALADGEATVQELYPTSNNENANASRVKDKLNEAKSKRGKKKGAKSKGKAKDKEAAEADQTISSEVDEQKTKIKEAEEFIKEKESLDNLGLGLWNELTTAANAATDTVNEECRALVMEFLGTQNTKISDLTKGNTRTQIRENFPTDAQWKKLHKELFPDK